MSDIWQLVRAIRDKTPIPRTLFRNGKRSKEEFCASQSREAQAIVSQDHSSNGTISLSQGSCQFHSPNRVPPLSQSSSRPSTTDQSQLNTVTGDSAFRSSVLRDLGLIKSNIDLLKLEVQELKGKLNKHTSMVNEYDTCLLYLRLKHPTSEALGSTLLESKLNTTVLAYDIIKTVPTPAFRIKIQKSLLHYAITHVRCNYCIADIWKCPSSAPCYRAGRKQYMHPKSPPPKSLTVTTWNCRGLSQGTPYLTNILDSGSDVVILSEHWLWPFELHMLDEIHPDFSGLGNADSRLTETSDKNRGCGGIGIVWRKSLDTLDGDEGDAWLSVIGVYLPCLDLGMELYQNTLIELERVISESAQLGPVIVAGDFNAHLGSVWGPRAHNHPNVQCVLLGELLDRCKPHATSISETASGPSHAYRSGDIVTTVDYIIADIEASSCIEHCWTHEEDNLNTSDHLPISVTISCEVATQHPQDPNLIRINWSKAEKSGALRVYQDAVKERLSPFIGRSRGSITQVECEIKHVAWLIKNAAEKTLPHFKPRRIHRFKDRMLSRLCAKSKEAWRAWCEDGRPSDGPLYEAKCSLRNEVRRRIRVFCHKRA